ncbi:MAG: fumarylacetoacetate hydrolase family protein [Candidatus Dormiibacterota bacterium]
MHIVRYLASGDPPARVGILADGAVHPIAGVPHLADLLQRPLAEIRAAADGALASEGIRGARLLPPLDGLTEVWGAGVTYEVSKTARVEETAESTRSVYERVYDAERPELFFKSVAWRVVTSGEPVAIRADSALNVPEPELVLAANAAGEIVGFAAGNDLTARAIEGENPLYLPQAKLFAGATAISPGIRPAWEIPDPSALEVRMTIERDGAPAWSRTTPTARLRRRLEDLVAYLFRGDFFPDGALLCTGTGLVPELEFTLQSGDRIEIEIPDVGLLSNPVLAGKEGHRWVVAARTDAAARPPLS